MTEYCHRLFAYESRSGAAFDGRFALPGSVPHYAPDRTFDSTHIKLELDFDIPSKSYDGVCTTSVRAFRDVTRDITFDAVDMKIKDVRCAGKKCRYTHKDGKLKVTMPRAFKAGEQTSVEVRYRVERPKLGLYFIVPDKDYPDLPTQIWTQGQDEYSRYWFPCHDAPQEKATSEMVATVPEDFFVVSNGKLLDVKHDKRRKRKTYHWRIAIAHSPYLVTLAAGRWVELKDSWAGIPITYYTEKGREPMVRLAFGKTPKMVKFFSQAIGVKYAYEKYAQVAAAEFIYGGMENTSATTQTDIVLCDKRALAENWHEGLVAHELAHQWFGDLLTCKDWSHSWLNESFATYFDALYDEHDHGVDSFKYHLLGNARTYKGEDKERYRRPIVTNVYKNPSDIFDRHLYEKGSLVLHMLRYVLGDDLWWRSIKIYVEDNLGKSVETVDLINAIEKATGRNLRWFFDQWVFKAGHPDYRVVYSWDKKAKEAVVWVVQRQRTDAESGLFRMPIVFEFELKGGRRRFTEEVSGKEHTFRWKLPSEPVLFRVDPGNYILKSIEVTKPRSMWLYQLEHDRDSMGRVAAARNLGRMGGGWAVEALARALKRERFWGAQIEIARALGDAGTDAAYAALVEALTIKNVKARRAVAEAMAGFKRKESIGHLKKALEAKDSYYVPAEALRAIGRTRSKEALKVLKEHLAVKSWNDSIAAGAIDGLGAYNDEAVIPVLTERTKLGHNHISRASAVRALGNFAKGRPEVSDRLIELVRDRHIRVQAAAISMLGRAGDPRALPALQDMMEGERADGRLRRMAEEAARQIREGLDLDTKGADELKKENAELKKKLERLEKKGKNKGTKAAA